MSKASLQIKVNERSWLSGLKHQSSGLLSVTTETALSHIHSKLH